MIMLIRMLGCYRKDSKLQGVKQVKNVFLTHVKKDQVGGPGLVWYFQWTNYDSSMFFAETPSMHSFLS